MIELIDTLLFFSRKIISIYVMAWAVTAIITFPLISLGSLKHIIFIDKQLAKDLSKYYDDKGFMRPKYQLSWEIGNRLNYYCLAYPFIKSRASTDSKKFQYFMWWNTLGMWFFWGLIVIGVLPKMLNLT
jgi:hypothetical protein